MSRFSRCTDAGRIPPATPAPKVCKIVLALTLCAVFALGHVHLRFGLNDLRRETGTLQAEQGKLLSAISRQRNVNEALKHPKALREHARHELGMVPYDPARRDAISIPVELRTRYALARGASERQVAHGAGPAPDKQAAWLNALGERMGLTSDAVAAEAP